ncbi:MAG: efflux RND transporter permease subunit [Rhizobiales bacterium]|nr:efflux RND transporter permease subunit [Hyphomicrobiales bacterium]NRB15628.1 efflux RND transporter permease subunit [Hyphomicrobiales bacterium]
MKQFNGSLISFFVRHKTAANLLMLVIMLIGAAALLRLNTQLQPNTESKSLTINVNWAGASAEDVETSIISLIEPELQQLDNLQFIFTSANEGRATLRVRFKAAANLDEMFAQVENIVGNVGNLPAEAGTPSLSKSVFLETVAKLAIYGNVSEKNLVQYALKLRAGLLRAGLERVEFQAMRNEQISLNIDPNILQRFDLSLANISAKVKDSLSSSSAGDLQSSIEKKLRTIGGNDDLTTLSNVEIISGQNGGQIQLKDLANIVTEFNPSQTVGEIDGTPAIMLLIKRSANADTVKIITQLEGFLATSIDLYPKNVNIKLFQTEGKYVQDRINLLLENGLSGMILVSIFLFIFLNIRMAFWVAAGVPVAILATMIIMYLFGTAISMISMFALLMMLGIIVDDAIVVAEEAETLMSQGYNAADAAEKAATKMFKPVMAAALTTIAAFIPLTIIEGTLGQILIVFPIVVISVLIASLVECFFILPGHLRYVKSHNANPNMFRRIFNGGFEYFKFKLFLPLVSFFVKWRWVSLAGAFAILLISAGYVTSNRLAFDFFPTTESERIISRIRFAAGAKPETIRKDIEQIKQALYQAEQALSVDDEQLIQMVYVRIGGEADPQAFIEAQLTRSELRSVRTQTIIDKWIELSPKLPTIDRLIIQGNRSADNESTDVNIRLSGPSLEILKKSSEDLQAAILKIPGVKAADDDFPEGKREILVKLNAKGKMLGLSSSEVNRQLRNIYQGVTIKTIATSTGDIPLIIKGNDGQQSMANLYNFRIKTPQGYYLPLEEIADISEQKGRLSIRKFNGRTSITITADVDEAIITGDTARALIQREILPAILARYGIESAVGGHAADQAQAISDLQLGIGIALALIYIILAWVFASYMRPFAVMFIIPFGFVGAVIGHLVMGFNLSALSLFGLLGLAGILVNDSIILVARIEEHLDQKMDMFNAAIYGACDRLRAVLLTSITTIAGLTPLLFEKSLQAQFLLPLAITMVFGLLIATILVLVLVPVIICCMDDIHSFFKWLRYGRDWNNPKNKPEQI